MDPSGGLKIAESLISKVGIPGLIGIPSFILFGPKSWVTTLGLQSVRDDHKMYVGGALLLGVAMLVGMVWQGLVAWWQNWRQERKEARAMLKFYDLWESFDATQQDILWHMHYHPEETESHGLSNEVATQFLNLGLTKYRKSALWGQDFVLTPWASRGMISLQGAITEGQVKRQIESRRMK